MAGIEINPIDRDRIIAKLAGLSAALQRRVLVQETNRTASQMATDAARRVKADLPKLPYGTIRRRIEVAKATGTALTAELRIRKRAINLARFGARQTKKSGIKPVTTIAGQTKGPFRHAFIITAKFASGDGEGATKIAVQRVGKGGERLPLKALYGPTVMGVLVPHVEDVLKTAGERLLANITKRVDSELGGQQ